LLSVDCYFLAALCAGENDAFKSARETPEWNIRNGRSLLRIGKLTGILVDPVKPASL
jgi:hypothetical protein